MPATPDFLNHFFVVGRMVIPASIYWNTGIGRNENEVEQDEEGLRTMQIRGQNMAWAIKKSNA